MNDPAHYRTLLEQIEARQNEVLEQLDELNARAEQLLKQCLAERDSAEGREVAQA